MAKNPISTSACAHGAKLVTPSDSDDLADEARGIYVGGAGDVRVVTRNGDDEIFFGVPVGFIIPCYITKVFATGTDATNLLQLY